MRVNSPSDIHLGDCLEVMAGLEAESVDAIVTDPPYGIGFMGKDWDSPGGTGDFPMRRNDATNTVNTGVTRQGGRQRSCEDFAKRQARDARAFQAWCEEWATEALRVLKPGGHLLSFGGTRTYHRLASAIEDAGFEIRDCVAWMYGSGFPKGTDKAKIPEGWEGWNTALKPAFEPVVVARKSLIGTVAANLLEHGTGALNIDGCRIEGDTPEPFGSPRKSSGGILNTTDEPREQFEANALGRWPANVVMDEEAGAMLDAQSGVLVSGANPTRRGSDKFRTAYGEFKGQRECVPARGVDVGGASRFFYCAKVSKAEREAGLEGFPLVKSADDGYGSIQTPILDRAAPRENWEPHKTANIHPTVKPITLMRWLCRLVTPPGGTVLDPFMGSGSTGIAAQLEGVRFLGIERDEDYMAIALARLAFWDEYGEEAIEIVKSREAAEAKRGAIAETGQLDFLSETAA